MRFALPTLLGLIALLGLQSAPAQLSVGKSASLEFAKLDDARKVLTNRDEFVRSMSPFDRAARLKTSAEVSETEYLAFVANNILAWEDSDRQKVTAAFQGFQKEIEAFPLPFPGKILLIKTTGDEEGEAAYTRSNAIILPKHDLDGSAGNLQKTLCHELFHVLSRANPELRDRLYAAIGFVKCSEVDFPAELKNRKITNPDAPANDHCIRLEVDGSKQWAIPILYSRAEKYDPGRGGAFFDYLQFRFLLVERDEATGAVKPIMDGQKAKLVDVPQLRGFFEQVGGNTQYILHPEEILADNFVFVVRHNQPVPSPDTLDKLGAILKERTR